MHHEWPNYVESPKTPDVPYKRKICIAKLTSTSPHSKLGACACNFTGRNSAPNNEQRLITKCASVGIAEISSYRPNQQIMHAVVCVI